MSDRVFSYRPGSRVKGVAAEVAGAELERIHAERGELTPPAVVEEARPDDAPLHPAFEWDDIKAATAHREWQARSLIRAVYVRAEGDDEEPPAPLFVHVTSEDTGGYQPVSVVVRDRDLFAVAMTELQDKLNMARRAVEQMQEAADRAGNVVGRQKAERVRKHLEKAAAAAG